MLIFAILKQDETKKKKSMETNKYLCHTKKTNFTHTKRYSTKLLIYLIYYFMKKNCYFKSFALVLLSCAAMISCEENENHIPVLQLDENYFEIPAEGKSFEVKVSSNENIQLTSNRKDFTLEQEQFSILKTDKIENHRFVAEIDSLDKKLIHVTVKPNNDEKEIIYMIFVFSADSKAQGYIHITQHCYPELPTV